MCKDQVTGVPVHRVVIPGKIGGHALRALGAAVTGNLQYELLHHGKTELKGRKVHGTLISGVDDQGLAALRQFFDVLFPANPLAMTTITVVAKCRGCDRNHSKYQWAYTWTLDYRSEQVSDLMRSVDNMPPPVPAAGWMDDDLRSCDEARRLLNESYWAYWSRVYLVVGTKLPAPPQIPVVLPQAPASAYPPMGQADQRPTEGQQQQPREMQQQRQQPRELERQQMLRREKMLQLQQLTLQQQQQRQQQQQPRELQRQQMLQRQQVLQLQHQQQQQQQQQQAFGGNMAQGGQQQFTAARMVTGYRPNAAFGAIVPNPSPFNRHYGMTPRENAMENGMVIDPALFDMYNNGGAGPKPNN